MKNERTTKGMTELLYENDSYLFEFEAGVILAEEIEDNAVKYMGIVLDRTAFFPEGGGQTGDVGILECEKGSVRILDCRTIDGRVLHFADRDEAVRLNITSGSRVRGRVDASVRMAKMQNHSGEHLLLAMIHNTYGYDNIGFHMDENRVVFDIDGLLDADSLKILESKANEAIALNLPITVSYPEEEELEHISYRSKLELNDGVRLVSIEGLDICACCAPHVNATGAIEAIKIIDSFPHRGGTRITMIAGRRAYEDYQALAEANAAICELLSSKRYETVANVRRIVEKNLELTADCNALKKEIADIYAEKLLKERETLNGKPLLVFTESLDTVQLRNVLNKCSSGYKGITAGFIGSGENYNYIVTADDALYNGSLKDLAGIISEALCGRGGGSNKMIQGQVCADEVRIREFFRNLP